MQQCVQPHLTGSEMQKEHEKKKMKIKQTVNCMYSVEKKRKTNEVVNKKRPSYRAMYSKKKKSESM